MSAAMLKVFAVTNKKIKASTSQRGANSMTLAASPFPVTLPIRALTSWIAIMNGVVRNTVQSKP